MVRRKRNFVIQCRLATLFRRQHWALTLNAIEDPLAGRIATASYDVFRGWYRKFGPADAPSDSRQWSQYGPPPGSNGL